MIGVFNWTPLWIGVPFFFIFMLINNQKLNVTRVLGLRTKLLAQFHVPPCFLWVTDAIIEFENLKYSLGSMQKIIDVDESWVNPLIAIISENVGQKVSYWAEIDHYFLVGWGNKHVSYCLWKIIIIIFHVILVEEVMDG